MGSLLRFSYEQFFVPEEIISFRRISVINVVVPLSVNILPNSTSV